MNAAAYTIPVLFAVVLIAAAVRKVRAYDSFAEGVKGVLPLLAALFPYVAAVSVLGELFEASGLSAGLRRALAPAFSWLGVPEEIAPLLLIKPFSGSGALTVLGELLSAYGADSYVGRCASVVYASGETVFYLSAIYFAEKVSSGAKGKAALPVAIALVSNFAASVLGCLFCRMT